MSAAFIIASNGKPYSIRKLHHIADGITSTRESVSIFLRDLNKVITDSLSISSAAKFMKTVKEQDLRKKILLDPNGAVLGGELAIVKALFRDSAKVRIVRFTSWAAMELAYSPEHKRPAVTATMYEQ